MGPAPAQSSVEDLGQALGPDWLQLRDTPLGDKPIDLVLLHPRRGIALLQLAPHWTVDASARLRHRLDQARFGAIFHGHLPVVHRMIQPGEAAALPRLLAEAFAGQPALDLPAGDAWLRVVHRALLNRPSAPPEALRPAARPTGRRSLRIAGGLGLAGMLAAAALLARPGPAPEPQAVLADAVATPMPVAAASPMRKTVEEPAAEAKIEPAPLMLALTTPEPPSAQAAPANETATPVDALDTLGDLPHPPPVPVPPTLLSLVATSPVPAVPPPAVTAALATPDPIPVAPPPPPRPLATRRPGQDLAVLLRRGEALLALGDVSGARRFFERAAEAGDPAGAQAMGRTYDPAVLGGLQARGIAPDQALAADWYRRAREMTSTDITEMTR